VQADVITIRLRLPGLAVLGVKETGRWIEVAAQYGEEEADCPRCGRSTWQVHQWHLQRKRDAKLWGKEVWLVRLRRAASAAVAVGRCSRSPIRPAGGPGGPPGGYERRWPDAPRKRR